MAINFPSSPTNGQLHYDPVSGNRYFYDSVAGRWVYSANNEPFPIAANTEILFNNNGGIDGSTGLVFNPVSNTFTTNTIVATSNVYAAYFVGSGSALTDINAVTISNTAPTPAQAGDLWWDPNRGRFFIYYDDGSSTQWVETSPTGSGGGGGGGSTDLAPVYLYANGIYDLANAAFNRANNSNDVLFIVSAFDVANAAFNSANNVSPQIAPARDTANAAFDKANSANVLAYQAAIGANAYAEYVVSISNTSLNNLIGERSNAANVFISSVYVVSNAAFDKANAANVLAYETGIGANAYTNVSVEAANNYAGAMANASNAYADSLTPNLSPVFIVANAAFDTANDAYDYAAFTVLAKTNASYTVANAAFDKANAANVLAYNTGIGANAYTNVSIEAAYNYSGFAANAANAFANSTYVKKAGDIISGDLVVQGNATFSGVVTYANSQTLLIGDSLITLNNDIPSDVAPSEDSGIEIKRGNQPNVSIIWNEVGDRWTLTNDGSSWLDIATNTTVASANNYAGAMANGAGLIANNAYEKANDAYDYAEYTVLAKINASYTVANAAFDVANAAYGNANSVSVAANNYAGAMANSVNAYSSATYSTLTQWGYSFTVTNAAFGVANASFTYANNLGYFAGNNGDKGNATGLGDIFRVHSNTLTQNVTIYSGNNAMAAGPLSISAGRTLTIQTGARVSIV